MMKRWEIISTIIKEKIDHEDEATWTAMKARMTKKDSKYDDDEDEDYANDEEGGGGLFGR